MHIKDVQHELKDTCIFTLLRRENKNKQFWKLFWFYYYLKSVF